MIEVEDALQRIISAITPGIPETVPLRAALDRVLAQDVFAPISLPSFDNSAMDGYAVQAADVLHVRPQTPARLRCIGSVPAGTSYTQTVQPQTCVRIFTGSPLPEGADAVVMQEDTQTDGEFIEVLDAVKPWENVRLTGEDVKAGAVIARAGERLKVPSLAVLGAVGVATVSAARRPVVGILSTGNELVEVGAPLTPGKIYESNRAMISALVSQAGAEPRCYPIVQDTLEDTRTALERAFAECEAVITTGGVSVGEYDRVKAAFESLGGTLDFWKVAMRPGKPFVFGRRSGKILFGLPGNPVSAFVTFLVLVRPALLRMQGAIDISLPTHPGVLSETLHNRGGRRHFVRVCVDAAGQVRGAGLQASHALGSLAQSNGLVDVPPETLWPAGQVVPVLRWGN